MEITPFDILSPYCSLKRDKTYRPPKRYSRVYLEVRDFFGTNSFSFSKLLKRRRPSGFDSFIEEVCPSPDPVLFLLKEKGIPYLPVLQPQEWNIPGSPVIERGHIYLFIMEGCLFSLIPVEYRFVPTPPPSLILSPFSGGFAGHSLFQPLEGISFHEVAEIRSQISATSGLSASSFLSGERL